MSYIYAVDKSAALADLISELEENGIVCNVEQSEIINDLLQDWHHSPILQDEITGGEFVLTSVRDTTSLGDLLSEDGLDALSSFYTYLMIESKTTDELVPVSVITHKGDFSYLYTVSDERKRYIPNRNQYDLSSIQRNAIVKHLH